MSKTIRGLLVKEDKEPEVIEIPNNLKSLQNLVGGYIEYCYLPEHEDIVIICNEEGKINGMGPNRDIGHDIIFGPFLVVGDDPDIGENLSLTESKFFLNLLSTSNFKIPGTISIVRLIAFFPSSVIS